MLSQIANVHHSKLPKVGAIGFIYAGVDRFRGPLFWNDKKEKWQCIYFPLCDNVRPYSLGIHTAFFRNLTTGETRQFAGQYFHEN